MKIIDLNNLFEIFLQKTVSENPFKYTDVEALGNDIGELTDKWETTPNKALNDMSPRQFVEDLAVQYRLFDYVEDCLEADIEIADIVCYTLIKQSDAEEFLSHLLYSDIPDARMFGAVLLKENGSEKAEDIFLKAILNPNVDEEIKNIAFEFLSEDRPNIVDKILDLINTVKDETQRMLVEIMAEYKGRKDVFYWLVTMLYRAENVALYAKLLGQYDDTTAIDILKSFAIDNDIDYVEYLEIRNAVERLGGEFDIERDFSEDEIYKYMHSDIGDDSPDEQ